MSEGFHVHGPHDHALEHAAHNTGDRFAGRLAVTTAILATVGAIYSYMGGATQAAAALAKNDAAIRKSEASIQWAEFQAHSGKQALNELAMDILPADQRGRYGARSREFEASMEVNKTQAKKLEEEAIAFDEQSTHQLHQHHRWAQATTVLQIAIAMAAIALLTKRRWLLYGVYGLGTVGTLMGAYGWFQG